MGILRRQRCRVASASGTEVEDAALSGKRLPRQLPVWVAWKRVAASAPTIVFLADAAAAELPSAASREAPTATRAGGRRDRLGSCLQVGGDVACEYSLVCQQRVVQKIACR